ncbi:polysaccharide export outer membrane protein [Ectothiorhodospira mobilis]|uniref:Polysaccharide export outer membrane protein n=1 Tax=Ectothiorhodospira mobilis TaxID=195064 RepID=A0A1I4P8Z5_ECTMO|nr:XrtA/PEP-CTERM system exopolysaccharide export protein [Ectothiorhodospira mobilis]SFM24027.1 polysaccharide export outer membrane protein [Ectothiorhodospira mobilis]
MRQSSGLVRSLAFLVLAVFLGGCASHLPPLEDIDYEEDPDYIIGPGDNLNIFVWGQPELSMSVPVRPDGRITTPLIEDVQAANKTPTELARDMEEVLQVYVRDPVVTVIVTGFRGPYDQQIRVVGEATNPQAIPYNEHMTLLDVMIAVGGMTEFAAGNRASIVRKVNGETEQYQVRLDDLIRDGDIEANAPVYPGDILIIPESWF